MVSAAPLMGSNCAFATSDTAMSHNTAGFVVRALGKPCARGPPSTFKVRQVRQVRQTAAMAATYSTLSKDPKNDQSIQ